MRTSRPARALLAAFAALGGLVSFSNAQSVATTPVGAVTKNLVVGLNSLGISLINPDVLVANCSANTASALSLAGVANVGANLVTGTLYYVEVVAGDLEGERFDVDTAATIAAANGTVVLSASSVNNTFVLSAGNAVGSQIALRKHVTLAQVQSYVTTPLVGSNTPSSADQIWLLNSSGSAFAQYYLRADGVSWRLTTGATNVANTVVIPPGVGCLIQKRTSPAQLVVTGGVRTNDFAMPLSAGVAFLAPAYPISQSPASLGGTAALGWTGSNTPTSADQLRVLNAAGTNFTSYYLRADGAAWRLTTGATNVANDLLFAYDSGFIVARKTADANYILTSPISL